MAFASGLEPGATQLRDEGRNQAPIGQIGFAELGDHLTLFADGTSRRFETETRGQAENYAVGEKRKVGKVLTNRETGAEVRVVDVYVAAL